MGWNHQLVVHLDAFSIVLSIIKCLAGFLPSRVLCEWVFFWRLSWGLTKWNFFEDLRLIDVSNGWSISEGKTPAYSITQRKIKKHDVVMKPHCPANCLQVVFRTAVFRELYDRYTTCGFLPKWHQFKLVNCCIRIQPQWSQCFFFLALAKWPIC